jgi:hypothetical protein
MVWIALTVASLAQLNFLASSRLGHAAARQKISLWDNAMLAVLGSMILSHVVVDRDNDSLFPNDDSGTYNDDKVQRNDDNKNNDDDNIDVAIAKDQARHHSRVTPASYGILRTDNNNEPPFIYIHVDNGPWFLEAHVASIFGDFGDTLLPWCRTIRLARAHWRPNTTRNNNSNNSSSNSNNSSDSDSDSDSDSSTLVVLNVTFGCRDVSRHSEYSSSGNWVHALYALRLVAMAVPNVHLHLTCHDANDTTALLLPTESLLPWLMGHYAAARTGQSGTRPIRRGTAETGVCGNIFTAAAAPLGRLWQQHEMQYDFRRMAIALVVGTNSNAVAHSSSALVPQLAAPTSKAQVPLLANVTLDDAVIHLDCGGALLLNDSTMNDGVMAFVGYTRHISRAARTIGILTAPLGQRGNGSSAVIQPRRQPPDADSIENARRCKVLVVALQRFVHDQFPTAKVTIRNGPDETMALSYARIVMANQSVGAMSAFCTFPMVATFGTAYYLQPQPNSPSAWLLSRHPALWTDALTGRRNVILFRERQVLLGAQLRQLWDAQGDGAVLAWFRSITAAETAAF